MKLHLELDGEVDQVVRALRRIGVAMIGEGRESFGVSPAPSCRDVSDTAVVGGPETGALHDARPAGAWTERLASDFSSRLDPVSRRVIHQIRAAGDDGIHRRQLCQRAGLIPEDLRRLLISMGYEVRRFQRERGTVLSRPVVANSALQRYSLAADFAAVATSRMFGAVA